MTTSEPIPQQPCNLRQLYFDANGIIHLVADCGPCYSLEWAPSPAGPWYWERDGVAGQDIPVQPGDFPRYYRVVPRECEDTPQPQPVAQ